MEIFELKDFDELERKLLLEKLGFGTDGVYVVDEAGNKVKDRYTDVEVRFDNMMILPAGIPATPVILDNHPLSIANYIEEFGEIF